MGSYCNSCNWVSDNKNSKETGEFNDTRRKRAKVQNVTSGD